MKNKYVAEDKALLMNLGNLATVHVQLVWETEDFKGCEVHHYVHPGSQSRL